MFKKILTIAMLSMAVSAHAGVYKMGDNEINLEIKSGSVVGKNCLGESGCMELNVPVDQVVQHIQDRIKQFSDAVDKEGVLLDMAKKSAMQEGAQIINDAEADKVYRMLVLFDGTMRLPLEQELIDQGDYSLVVDVVKDRIIKMQNSLSILEKGEFPADLDAGEDYDKFAPMSSLFFDVLAADRANK